MIEILSSWIQGVESFELYSDLEDIFNLFRGYFTYDHRTLKTGLPVRSALLKQRTGGLVVRWVTTGESPLLYVFDIFVSLFPQLAPL